MFSLRIFLADHHRQCRIRPQPVVIVQIFISQAHPIEPLTQKIFDGMFDQLWISIVGETRGKLLDNSGPQFHFPQQQSASIRCDVAATEFSHDFPPTDSFKFQLLWFTLCHQKGRLRFSISDSSQSLNATRGGLFWSIAVANAWRFKRFFWIFFCLSSLRFMT